MFNEIVPFSSLSGKILKGFKLNDSSNELYLEFTDGSSYLMFHQQDCCESVWLEDVCGDLNDLVGEQILFAEESFSNTDPLDDQEESFTWTFYTLRTNQATVTLRWYGCSNGYYSESVSLFQIEEGEESEEEEAPVEKEIPHKSTLSEVPKMLRDLAKVLELEHFIRRVYPVQIRPLIDTFVDQLAFASDKQREALKEELVNNLCNLCNE